MQNNGTPLGAERLNYLDFELEIGPGSGREYSVSVIRSPAGEARETMRLPYDELTLENRLQSMQIALLRSGGTRRRVPVPEEQAVQEFGRDLFDALLTGEARGLYDISCREALQQGKRLRLKLRIQSPELAILPWEFLYDPRKGDYLCLSLDNSIVRYLELPQRIQPLAVAPPLRILGMIASPRDLPPLDIRREKQRIDTAIQDLRLSGLVNLTWLEGQTWRDLQRAMRGGPWHIFHFVGHGGFDRNADEGLIALADDNGSMHCLRATELARLLADHHSLRLVLLNSCEGARGSERDIFSSTATILVRRGMPAVLAMQYEITDRAAIEFARAFYEALADGLPVDASVTEARKAVSLAVTNTVEWGTPVLYMRAPQGVIFQLPETSRARQPAARRSPDKDTDQRLEQLYTDGRSAFWTEDWDKACSRFQAILDEDPDYPNAAAQLEEAKLQRELHALYTQARAAQEAKDWQTALRVLEKLVARAADFKDAAALLALVKKQSQLADLYGEARKLSQAKQWQAVVNIFAQISALDSSYADTEGLLPAAESEVAALKRQAELDSLYRQAVQEMDARRWQEARRLLATVQQMQPGFRDAERLLSRADAEIAREDAEQERQQQISTLYEQAIGLARTRQWRQALAKTQEIYNLDPQFADQEEIAARAREEIAREEVEAQRQNELATLYSEAVRLLRAQQYQAALEKWNQVQAQDARYPDRQKVQATARKKLDELAKPTLPQRRLPTWAIPAIAVLGLVAIAAVSVYLIGRGGAIVSTPTATLSSTSIPAVVVVPPPTPIPTVTGTPPPTATPSPTPIPTATGTPSPTPSPTATVDADPAVYDNFNNPAFDGGYDAGRWRFNSNDPLAQATQQNGVLAITINGNPVYGSLYIPQYSGMPNNPTFFEAKLKLEPGQKGGPYIGCWRSDEFNAQCGITSDTGGTQRIGCWSGFLGQRVNYGPSPDTIKPGTWHIVRLEIYPDTMTFKYVIDGQQVGTITPRRAAELKQIEWCGYAIANSCQGSCTNVGKSVTGYFDDVRIGPIGK